MSRRALSLLAVALVACTSHDPDVADPIAEALQETLSTRATPDDPTTWAARVVGDEVVDLALLADGSSTVVTEEGHSTVIDRFLVVAQHDPFGQLLHEREIHVQVGNGQRLHAIDGEGRLVVLSESGTVLHTVERDGTIVVRTLDWGRRGLIVRAVRGYPDGGFLVRAELPRPRDAHEHAWWSAPAFYLLARFDVAPADPKAAWRPKWVAEIGDDFADDLRVYGPIEVLSDGRIVTVGTCQDASGRRCTGADRRELAVLSADGEPHLRVPLSRQLDVVLAVGDHIDGGLVVAADVADGDDLRTRDVFFARYSADGQKVAELLAGVPYIERVHHAAIASGVAWVAVTQRDPDDFPVLPRGAVVRVDAGASTVELFPLASREPTEDTSAADVLRPTRVAAARGRVRVAGWYGWPSRLPFPDGSSVDLELRDARGIDDDVFVWAAAGRSAARR